MRRDNRFTGWSLAAAWLLIIAVSLGLWAAFTWILVVVFK